VFKRQRALRHLPHGRNLAAPCARPSTHGCSEALAETVAVQRPAVGAAAAGGASALRRRPAAEACGVELPLRPRPATRGGGAAPGLPPLLFPVVAIVIVVAPAAAATATVAAAAGSGDPAHRAEASLGADGALRRPACCCRPRGGGRRCSRHC
jgi:hypothetical protein